MSFAAYCMSWDERGRSIHGTPPLALCIATTSAVKLDKSASVTIDCSDVKIDNHHLSQRYPGAESIPGISGDR
jgi:hypothetical protein